jgi:hypothetical protein
VELVNFLGIDIQMLELWVEILENSISSPRYSV